MPEVFLKKIIGNILIGTLCMLSGIIIGCLNHDSVFLIMSLVLALCIYIRVWLLYKVYKKEKYVVIEGVCTSVERKLFSGYKIVHVETTDDIIKLYLPKDLRVEVNSRYSFYFRKHDYNTGYLSAGLICRINLDSFIGAVQTDD